MKSTVSTPAKPKAKPQPDPSLEMRNDPRFLQILCGVAGGALAQFEIYHMLGRGMDYEGADLVETIHGHGDSEDARCEQQARRIWKIAKELYWRLTNETQDEDEATEFSDSL